MATTSSGADPAMVNKIANHLKSQGIFDQFRRDCLEDVDTKPAYQNLRQKVEGYVSSFLANVKWEPKLNKNQLRDSLRRQINQSEMLSAGVERIIEQVIEPKMHHVFRPQIEKVVDEFLGVEVKAKAESAKKDLASTSGWQAPAPPELPPEVPSPAPPLPPSEPPAAPPEAPPEAPPDTPPDSPPEDPEVSSIEFQDTLKSFQVDSSPTTSSGRNTPSTSTGKTVESPSLTTKQSGTIPQATIDVKTEKKTLAEISSETSNKSAILIKSLIIKSVSSKGQYVKPQPSKDQGAKKPVSKDQPLKTQSPKPIKKVSTGGKDCPKAVEKPKSVTPTKPPVANPKTQVDAKDQGPSKLAEDDMNPQTFLKKTDAKSPIREPEKKLIHLQDSTETMSIDSISSKADSEVKMELKLAAAQSHTDKDDSSSISSLLAPVISATAQDDSDMEVSMDLDADEAENTEEPSKEDASDGESGLSDISVSSVHTSDLSSFDEDISSTSSSSTVDSSSDEDETQDKRLPPKEKKPAAQDYTSSSDSDVPSELTISTDTSLSRPASAASDKPSLRKSPKTLTTKSKALAISRYHSDSEDEDSRQERRKQAALAKEERAQRRQQVKEEREKAILEKREKRALASKKAEEISEAKKTVMKEEVVTASPQKTTKEQLKEQKILEKKREVRRRRSLNKRYFSDEFASSLQGLKETASQQDYEETHEEPVKQTELIPVRSLFRKEKQQCFHLIYRERRDPQVKCHHLLNQELSGEQQKKQSKHKRKERRDSKIPRFSFAHSKVVPAETGEGRRSSAQSRTKEIASEQQRMNPKKQVTDVKDECQDEKCKQSMEEEPHVESPKRDSIENLTTEQQHPDVLPAEVEQKPLPSEEPDLHVSSKATEGEDQMEQEMKEEVAEVHLEAEQAPVLDQQGETEDAVQNVGQDESETVEEKQDLKEEPSPHEDQEDSVSAEAKPEHVQKEDVKEEECDVAKEEETEVCKELTAKTETICKTDESSSSSVVQEEKCDVAKEEETEVGKEVTTETETICKTDESSSSSVVQEEEVKGPPTTEDEKPPTPPPVPMETDELDNPPTPTQDEPSIYSDADSESEEHSEKGLTIPIYTVHSPKHLPLGSVFKLSQTPLQDIKPVGSGSPETRPQVKDGEVSQPDDAEGSESSPQPKEEYQRQDSHESNTDSEKLQSETREGLSESPDKPSASETSESSQPESRYGTRSKRQAVSPRDSVDDDYFYYGQPKRGRYTQSPVSPQEEASRQGRSRTRRVSSDSGKSEGTSRDASDRPTRSSHQRHVSPPHRYSPSDNRASRRSSASSPKPPPASSPPGKQGRRASSPSSHEHFTRRSSGREEAKRGKRFSDMYTYYYNERGARNQGPTRGGDKGRNPEPVSSRRSSRRSVDDRPGNQTAPKRRK